MIIGRWSTRALGELQPYDNDVLVFLPDGTGWIYVMNRKDWFFDTFIWKYNENGSLCIEGQIHEYNDEEFKVSGISFKEVFYTVELISPKKIATFSTSLSSGHIKYGFDDDGIPNLNKDMNEPERIHELIKFLHWDTPKSVIENVIKELVQIDNQYLPFLLQPMGKAYWDNAALVLSEIEYVRLEPLIPGMIEWMRDLNWPGAMTIANLLCNIGEAVVPHLKIYFLESDDQLISWILSEIVGDWPKTFVVHVQTDLVRLAQRVESSEYVRVEAERILKEHALL